MPPESRIIELIPLCKSSFTVDIYLLLFHEEGHEFNFIRYYRLPPFKILSLKNIKLTSRT
ncbi:hypothetical protein Pint_08245 [Pistacia integerrima]|uniref:Uncharacterized protein n=1 Tax=Pistacia integerrima TaxID=434235 RepID=A0ACC0XX30_9ROSI|nr:hypothetical protein Pint_08245 [Pistacia integerrima]